LWSSCGMDAGWAQIIWRRSALTQASPSPRTGRTRTSVRAVPLADEGHGLTDPTHRDESYVRQITHEYASWGLSSGSGLADSRAVDTKEEGEQ
jgi:hypothetical protein